MPQYSFSNSAMRRDEKKKNMKKNEEWSGGGKIWRSFRCDGGRTIFFDRLHHGQQSLWTIVVHDIPSLDALAAGWRSQTPNRRRRRSSCYLLGLVWRARTCNRSPVGLVQGTIPTKTPKPCVRKKVKCLLRTGSSVRSTVICSNVVLHVACAKLIQVLVALRLIRRNGWWFDLCVFRVSVVSLVLLLFVGFVMFRAETLIDWSRSDWSHSLPWIYHSLHFKQLQLCTFCRWMFAFESVGNVGKWLVVST